jgi:zinc protease
MADIEGYRVRDCQQFYRTWYAPNNATIVVVGDFDTKDVLGRIEEAYGAIEASKLPSRAAPAPSRQRKERRARMKWPTPSEKLSVAWHAPAHVEYDSAVLEVIDELLTGGRSARLRRRLVEELELVAELRGGVTGLAHGGLFDLSISMREGVPAEKALVVIDEEIERLIREPIPAVELTKVKNRAELFFLSEIEGVNGKASQIGFADIVAGDPGHTFTRLAELRRVSAEDVARVARERLRSERRSMVHVVPDEAS